MKYKSWFLGFISCSTSIFLAFGQGKDKDPMREKTAFQTSSPWMPEIDILADVAIVYGVHGNPTDGPQVLASASRISNEVAEANGYSFVCKSPLNTVNAMRVYLPKDPKNIAVVNEKGDKLTEVTSEWDKGSNTLFLSFDNDPEGIAIKITW